jgi:hypothetical protein
VSGARDRIMDLASRIAAELVFDWPGEMRRYMDDYAHELAERIRRACPDHRSDGSAALTCHCEAAGWIDPEAQR